MKWVVGEEVVAVAEVMAVEEGEVVVGNKISLFDVVAPQGSMLRIGNRKKSLSLFCRDMILHSYKGKKEYEMVRLFFSSSCCGNIGYGLYVASGTTG